MSIAAASILAKAYRDRLMRNAAQRYPGYGWETNAVTLQKTQRSDSEIRNYPST